MKILIAADSFKDALDTFGVCAAISRGVAIANPELDIQCFPLADGGEGSVDVLAHHLGGQKQSVQVSDPLGRKITTDYLLAQDSTVAILEMAKACGLQLLTPEERNPLRTSSYGLGEMIADAIDRGVDKIVLAIGGSATNDAGIGMATALGIQFLDESGAILPGIGADLLAVKSIHWPEELRTKLSKVEFSVLCDVKNKLYGPQGAAHVFGKQKGATPAAIEQLDAGLKNIAVVLREEELAQHEGAGAAGGLGFGAMVFLNARLHRGIDLIMEMTNFEAAVRTADLILTGEGKIDGQTADGKLIQGITALATKHQKPVIAFCGALEAPPQAVHQLGLQAAFSICNQPLSLAQALANTAANLEATAYNITQTLTCWTKPYTTIA